MAIAENITELGTKPIGSLLLKYATPAVIAMTASSLYNIIDAIFIGQGVGPLAIAGVSLSFPVMQVTSAFGAMVGVGAATLLSVKLGERDYDTARKILGNVLLLNIIMGVVMGALMLAFINPILYFFGASDETVSYARDFMTIVLLGNVVTHLYLGMNSLLRASGHPREAMFATIGTVCLNILFAPLFIYAFKWGIQGAAAATVLSQLLVLIWELWLFSNPNEFIHFQRKHISLDQRIVTGTLSIGMSPFLMNLCGCIVTVFFNWSLAHYGSDLEIAAYGINNRLAFFFAMIVVGLNQGMQPIAGYNYGAQNYDRLRKVVKIAMVCATIVCTIGFLVAMFAAYPCARLFTKDEALISLAETAIRMMMMMFPIVGFQIVVTNFFQSTGKAKISMFLSLSRQLLFLVPALAIFSEIWGLWGVWIAMPFSDALATVVAAVMMKKSSVWKK